jgi:hypothetical protein
LFIVGTFEKCLFHISHGELDNFVQNRTPASPNLIRICFRNIAGQHLRKLVVGTFIFCGQDAEISRLEKAVRHHENTIAALRANIENLTNEKNRFSEDLKELRPEYEKLKGTYGTYNGCGNIWFFSVLYLYPDTELIQIILGRRILYWI